MSTTGNLRKMQVINNNPVDYYLVLNKDKIYLNPLIGKKITLHFTQKINCVACNNAINKTFNQGYCYHCFKTLAQCDMCILKPELCHFHKNTCREPQWGVQNCFVPHIVYLANTSGLKVGISRENNIPIRWIDQGAQSAIPIIRVQSRFQSGLIEKEIAKNISDKTNWRKMLEGEQPQIDLESGRDQVFYKIASKIQKISKNFPFGDIELLMNEKIVVFQYPVKQYLSKIKSFNFDKESQVTGILQGIKGQYLIFDSGVINIRKFSGYEINFT